MTVENGSGRAPYACDPGKSHGRRFPEPASRTRGDFRRDCDRVIHSTAFRRLKHKTQVFVYHEGDHYRTRLTHTLEVQQVARSIARALGLDEDLAEALALAHDLGHPPFGHAGERALDECLAADGGFDHNAQTLRVVTALERRYAAFDGLNLTWETLEGLVKHNGPLIDAQGSALGPYMEKGVPAPILNYAAAHDLQLATFASAEAQTAAIADDIAYDVHDLDDGLRAGLFTLEDLREIGFVGAVLDEIERCYPSLETARRVHELMRRLLTLLIEDVIGHSREKLAEIGARNADDVRGAKATTIAFSPGMAANERTLKQFLYPRMYRHARVMDVMAQAQDIVRDLFRKYRDAPNERPGESDGGAGVHGLRSVGDYIAGMTDRFALAEHQRLFASTPALK